MSNIALGNSNDLSPVILRELQAIRRRQTDVSTTPVKVPNSCSHDLRQAYKVLQQADPSFRFSVGKDDKFTQDDNVRVFRRLVKAVRDMHGGSEQCPYTQAMFEGAAKRYFKSIKDSYRRKVAGEVERHTQMY